MDIFSTTSHQVVMNITDDTKRQQADPKDGYFMSKITSDIIDNVIHVGIIPVLALCGVTLNILSMVVFYRQGLSDRVNLCIFSLAVCDTCYMILIVARNSYRILSFFSTSAGEFWKTHLIYLISFYIGFFNTANCLTLLISLERCFCVVWPLKAKTILSFRKIQILILLAFIICFGVTSVSIKYDVEAYTDPTTNATRHRLVLSDFFKRNSKVLQFIFENTNIVLPTTSVCIVMVNTIIISVRLRKAMTWRQETANTGDVKTSSKETSVTRTLTVVCIIYTVCNIPYVMLTFVRLTVPEFGTLGKFRYSAAAARSILHTLLCINSSSNFVVYYTMSSKFRDTLHGLFKRRRIAMSQSKEGSSKLSVSK